jgi:hypothetical protein
MLAFVFFVAGSVHAQSTLAQLQTDMVSSWLGTIEGDAKGRTLRIKGVSQKTDGIFLLEADYGFFDGKQTSVKAEISQIGQERKLSLVTQSDSLIVATQDASGTFVGTFTLKNGVSKAIRIEKISEVELSSVVSAFQNAAITKAMNDAPTIEPPAADVPVSCAAFLGGWSGVWPNVGRVWLWVVSVDAKCGAKYSYGASSNVPQNFKMADIKDGVLSIPRASGSASFEANGNEISGRYTGTDGTNAAMMQKVSLTDGSLAKLRVEQRNSVIRPPAPDVPAVCAFFFGTWTGTWSVGSAGQNWLRVVGVDANCIAKITYSGGIVETTEIKRGVLSFLCNKSTEGTCNFERHGDDLWGSYHNPAGGTNNGVFRKTK